MSDQMTGATGATGGTGWTGATGAADWQAKQAAYAASRAGLPPLPVGTVPADPALHGGPSEVSYGLDIEKGLTDAELERRAAFPPSPARDMALAEIERRNPKPAPTTPAGAARADYAGAARFAATENPSDLDEKVAAGRAFVAAELAKQPFRDTPSWHDLHAAVEAVLRFVLGGVPAPAAYDQARLQAHVDMERAAQGQVVAAEPAAAAGDTAAAERNAQIATAAAAKPPKSKPVVTDPPPSAG